MFSGRYAHHAWNFIEQQPSILIHAIKIHARTNLTKLSYCFRMYSSLETPSTSSGSHQNQFQYHSNAFNMHSTANPITSTTGAPKLAPASNGSVKSTTRPFTDAHSQQSSTIFNNINSNRSKYGAYNSTCSNNNFEDVKHNIRTTTFNEKMWVK